MSSSSGPHIVVLSSLFPSARQPGAGLFVRERVFRVGAHLPLCVVAPTPWFPLQGLLRWFRHGFRPGAPTHETQRGFDVWFPRFFSLPGVLKRLDGWFMAFGAYLRLRRLRNSGRLDLIDAHFGYPDGYAAGLLSRWLGVPYCVTLRGTEERHSRDPVLAPMLGRALRQAARVFSVSESLRAIALSQGVDPQRALVVGNGVDLSRFFAEDRSEQRRLLGLPSDAAVLITVGGLVERKGFHRVIEVLPSLLSDHPNLHYLVVGGPSPEGDWTSRLKELVKRLALDERVHFVGPQPPDALRSYLSAADVFVLSTRNEGWANVILEAMACGLPVVATDVGGNAEVVSDLELGTIVPFGDAQALRSGLHEALSRQWNRERIRLHAEANTWDSRIVVLRRQFLAMVSGNGLARGRAGVDRKGDDVLEQPHS